MKKKKRPNQALSRTAQAFIEQKGLSADFKGKKKFWQIVEEGLVRQS